MEEPGLLETAVPPGGGRRDVSSDGDGYVGQTQNAARTGNVKPSLKEGKTKGRISGTVFQPTRALLVHTIS